MPTSTGPTAEAIAAFERDLARTRSRAAPLIDTLSRALENSGDVSDEFYWTQIDDLKGHLGEECANACSGDLQDQDDAISDAENWVADNISNADHETWVAAVLTLQGDEEGERIIREHLMQPSWRQDPAPS